MEYNIFIFLLLLVFLIVSFYYFRLIKNIYTFFNIKDNSLSSIRMLSYESCIIIISIQSIFAYSIFNSLFLRNVIKLLVLDFFII